MANVPTLYGTENSFLFIFSHSQNYQVLKPKSDHTVRPEKPRTANLCGSFSLKNPSMEKSRDPCEPQSDLTILRTMIRPLLTIPYFPLNLNLKNKIKNTHTQKNKL